MPRLLTIPQEPLARFRLLAVGFAASIAALNVFMFAVGPYASHPLELPALAAGLLLGAWWVYGYLRGGFPVAGWVVDAVLLVFLTDASPMPLRAIGIFFAGVQLRALYVSRFQLLLLLVSYDVARFISIALAPTEALEHPFSGTSIIQVMGLSVIAISEYLFVSATKRQADIERALKRSDDRYRMIASATRDVVYDWNVLACTIEWTESMHAVFGYTPDDVGTQPSWWLTRVHPEDREGLERAVDAAVSNPSATVENVRYRVQRADGSYAHVSGSMLVERGPDGAARRVVGSIRDITNEQQLEEQLRQSQKMEAVGQLAGGVAHDFNNLLTVVGGHVYMLEQTAPPGAVVEKHVVGIKRAAERAATLTRQLLAFSRRQILTPRVLDVNAVVDETLQMVRPVLGEHVQIVTRLDPLVAPVFVDAGQLGQVLVNLALNARDAMSSGGTLSIESGHTTIEAEDDELSPSLPPGEYVHVIVRDTGVGMEPDTLARAFEPFFTTKPKGAGSGLGLATAYGIVKQSFGDIRATSTPGHGSAFTVLLPIASESHSEEPVAAPRQATSREPRFAGGRNVLLVEDNDGVREFAQDTLVRAGYRVQAATNGADALKQTLAPDFAVDFVVTDVVMPQMGGREMVQYLRRRWPDLPVLYITGYTDDSRMLDELRSADARLLEKPFTASALAFAVAELSDIAPGVAASAD